MILHSNLRDLNLKHKHCERFGLYLCDDHHESSNQNSRGGAHWEAAKVEQHKWQCEEVDKGTSDEVM